mgnify:CR=1 FL=1
MMAGSINTMVAKKISVNRKDFSFSSKLILLGCKVIEIKSLASIFMFKRTKEFVDIPPILNNF